MRNPYDIIKEINEKKTKQSIYPCSATFREIMESIESEVKHNINELVKSNRVVFCQTINDFSFDIVKDEKNDKV